MGVKEICFILLLCVALVASQSKDRNKKKYKVVCYLGSWANYRHGDGKFLIEHIDPFLCTHLIYGFAKLAGNKIAVYDPYLDLRENWGLGAFERFNQLKKANPELSTLIAIGGWNEGSTKYSQMAANPAARATFIQSVIDFCEKYGFDGLDMDWEYPANRGGKPEDKQNFVTLLKELKAAFQPHGYILSAAVAAGESTMESAYDIAQVATYLDFINVMAYDLHGSWEKQVGHNAPLYARPEESDAEKKLNVDHAINYWIKKGAPRNKVILGMGTYGRSFTLASASETGLGAAATGPGRAGPITKEPGMLGYNEICKSKWTEVWVDKVEAPYAYSENQWVGYDNIKSIEIKSDYIIKNNLGGGMIWSLETDDFRGLCHNEKYPLLAAINRKLNGDVTRPTPDPKVTVPPVKPTGPPTKEFKCPGEGYFRDQNNCSVFYFCVKVGNDLAKHTYNCGEEQAFDETHKVCAHKKDVPGC